MDSKIVIIPTYNEKENIEKIIRAVLGLEGDYHMIIIDDGSPDGTADIVKRLQKEFPSRHLPRVKRMWLNKSDTALADSILYSRSLKSTFLRDIVTKQHSAEFFNKSPKNPHGSFEVICSRSQQYIDYISEDTFIKVASQATF